MQNVMIIGCGGIAPEHIEGYLCFPELARITVLADADTARAEAVKQKYHLSDAKVVADYRDGLADATLVSICTPPGLHAVMALDALNAGCHVLLEKPMAPTLEECDAMLDAARINDCILSVVGQSRYISGIRNVIEMVKDGAYGKAHYARVQSVWYRGQSYYDLAWRGRWEVEGGGCTLNHSIHHIDLLLWAKGMPASLSAIMRNLNHQNSEEEDFSSAWLSYADGSIAEITSSLVSHGEPQFLQFQMEKAGVGIPFTAYASKARANGFPEPDDDMKAAVEADFAARPKLPHENHDGQVGNLLRAIEYGEPLLATGQDGRNAIETITGIYKSALTGKPVSFPIAKDDLFYTTAWRKTATHFHEKSKDVAAFADTTITSFKNKF